MGGEGEQALGDFGRAREIIAQVDGGWPRQRSGEWAPEDFRQGVAVQAAGADASTAQAGDQLSA
ncbi:MAG: hypothetical protein WBR35_18410, partial [Anaerolineae bacterium]